MSNVILKKRGPWLFFDKYSVENYVMKTACSLDLAAQFKKKDNKRRQSKSPQDVT